MESYDTSHDIMNNVMMLNKIMPIIERDGVIYKIKLLRTVIKESMVTGTAFCVYCIRHREP